MLPGVHSHRLWVWSPRFSFQQLSLLLLSWCRKRPCRSHCSPFCRARSQKRVMECLAMCSSCSMLSSEGAQMYQRTTYFTVAPLPVWRTMRSTAYSRGAFTLSSIVSCTLLCVPLVSKFSSCPLTGSSWAWSLVHLSLCMFFVLAPCSPSSLALWLFGWNLMDDILSLHFLSKCVLSLHVLSIYVQLLYVLSHWVFDTRSDTSRFRSPHCWILNLRVSCRILRSVTLWF